MCKKCNNLTSETFTIKNRGYGSIFDLDEIEIPLCSNCIKELKVKKEWFDEKPNEYGEYKFEGEIEKLIIQLNMENFVKSII